MAQHGRNIVDLAITLQIRQTIQTLEYPKTEPFLYPRHTKYVGVYSFRFSVRTFVRLFVRSFVFPSQGQSFCVKVYKTSYFEDPLMDLVHIWHDGRYRSKIFIRTIPSPGVALGSRSRTWKFCKKVTGSKFLC